MHASKAASSHSAKGRHAASALSLEVLVRPHCVLATFAHTFEARSLHKSCEFEYEESLQPEVRSSDIETISTWLSFITIIPIRILVCNSITCDLSRIKVSIDRLKQEVHDDYQDSGNTRHKAGRKQDG